MPGAVLNIYAGGDHGLPTTHQDRFNADLLAFVQEDAEQDAAPVRELVKA